MLLDPETDPLLWFPWLSLCLISPNPRPTIVRGRRRWRAVVAAVARRTPGDAVVQESNPKPLTPSPSQNPSSAERGRAWPSGAGDIEASDWGWWWRGSHAWIETQINPTPSLLHQTWSLKPWARRVVVPVFVKAWKKATQQQGNRNPTDRAAKRRKRTKVVVVVLVFVAETARSNSNREGRTGQLLTRNPNLNLDLVAHISPVSGSFSLDWGGWSLTLKFIVIFKFLMFNIFSILGMSIYATS